MHSEAQKLAIDGVEMGFRVVAAELNKVAFACSDKEIAKRLLFKVVLQDGDSMELARKYVYGALVSNPPFRHALRTNYNTGNGFLALWLVGYVNDMTNPPLYIVYDSLREYGKPMIPDCDSVIDFLKDRNLSFEEYKRLIFDPVKKHHRSVIRTIKEAKP
ncbi:hypothetical protein VN12_04450 [Pirellula sp. SH-Sr6A]|uniref:hypothetical protein n=1 Tax=Pirellula sp. SH-Sr6A TaxID=1632865 RepID=UPI00078BDEA3|nr:hypothetical protein [Pirellula sp. SH-Sr6A]AMV31344.1 hypothetical protein VN12_04450 [Pirellula sp. SH-Sr6A]